MGKNKNTENESLYLKIEQYAVENGSFGLAELRCKLNLGYLEANDVCEKLVSTKRMRYDEETERYYPNPIFSSQETAKAIVEKAAQFLANEDDIVYFKRIIDRNRVENIYHRSPTRCKEIIEFLLAEGILTKNQNGEYAFGIPKYKLVAIMVRAQAICRENDESDLELISLFDAVETESDRKGLTRKIPISNIKAEEGTPVKPPPSGTGKTKDNLNEGQNVEEVWQNPNNMARIRIADPLADRIPDSLFEVLCLCNYRARLIMLSRLENMALGKRDTELFTIISEQRKLTLRSAVAEEDRPQYDRVYREGKPADKIFSQVLDLLFCGLFELTKPLVVCESSVLLEVRGCSHAEGMQLRLALKDGQFWVEDDGKIVEGIKSKSGVASSAQPEAEFERLCEQFWFDLKDEKLTRRFPPNTPAYRVVGTTVALLEGLVYLLEKHFGKLW